MTQPSIFDLTFDPAPECDRDGCCDLECVWPAEEAAPPLASVDQGTADRLALVADPKAPVGRDAVAEFLAACEADAQAHDGLVSVSRVGAALPEDLTSTERYSSFWSAFTGRDKPMRKVTADDGKPLWETREGSRSGNDGKPFRNRIWVGRTES